MRFDSLEHLAAWQATGRFPKIHDNIVAMAVTELAGVRLLDLGCSYGLLGAQLLKRGAAITVTGIDVDEDVIRAAVGAGVPVGFCNLKVERGTFMNVHGIIQDYQITAVVARRIFPELFGADLEAGKEFANILHYAGIKEMVVEGRVISPNAVNQLQGIDQEVAMLSGSFQERKRVGAVSYLTAR